MRGAAITCRSDGKARQWSGRCLGAGGEAHRERSETLATEPEPKERRAEQSVFPPDGQAGIGAQTECGGFCGVEPGAGRGRNGSETHRSQDAGRVFARLEICKAISAKERLGWPFP